MSRSSVRAGATAGGTTPGGLSGPPPEQAAQSVAVQNYLKAIFSLGERGTGPVTTSRLSERLKVTPSSASGMLRRLAEMGLVEHERYASISLTAQGAKLALQVVRRHRLIEMYLFSELGFTWDEVHVEAEELEHAISDRLLARIDAKLGHPGLDPHGDPIPTAGGEIETIEARRLTELAAGDQGQLVRVDDHDPAVLRHLSERGIALGQPVELVERLPFDGPYVIRAAGTEHQLGPRIAVALWIG